MGIEASSAITIPAKQLHLRVAWLCGAVLFLEGYDIAAVGYAIPHLVDAWRVRPAVFTQTLTAGNVGLLLGSLCEGLLGDRLRRKPVLIACVAVFGAFSLLSALVGSPSQLAALRFVTGLGLGGGIPLAIALTSDFAPPARPGRFLILMNIGVATGFAVGGLLASHVARGFGWPAIFIIGGVLPLAMVPVLAAWLPESAAINTVTRERHLVRALFQHPFASTTLLLWAINLLNLLGIYFILQRTPALLHSSGVSPSRAILVTSMYGFGLIVGNLLMAPIVDRFGIERVLTWFLAFGAVCVVSIGLFNPGFWLLSLIVCGAGIGAGSQAGINSLSGLAYPSAIRSTGAGWALGVGRIGTITGPLLGGLLLALGFSSRNIFVAAAIPRITAALLMTTLGRLRRGRGSRETSCLTQSS